MNGLPKGWANAKIEQVAQLSSGFGFPKHLQGKKQGRYPFAKVGDISAAVRRGASLLSSADHYVDESDLKILRAKPVPAGSTVFAKIGEALKLNRRALTTSDVVLDNNCMALSPNSHVVDGRFLFKFMSTIDLGPMSIATTVPSVRKGDVEGIEIPLPPLAEQRRIVAKLDGLSARSTRARHELDRIPILVARYKQAILTKAFSGELTADWRKTQSTSSWKFEPAERVCEKVQSGGTPKEGFVSGGGVPFLKVYNLVDQQINFAYRPQFVSYEVHEKSLSKSRALPGDVVMNIVGPPLGKVAIIPNAFPLWNLNQALTLFRPSNKTSSEWIYYFLCSGHSVSSVVNETRGSAGQVNISLSQCRAFVFPVPPGNEQEEILLRIKSAFNWLDKIAAQHSLAERLLPKLDQAILAKAFRGELVPQDPNDEPASMLLKRIKDKH